MTANSEVRALVPDLYYSVSYTTRAPRAGETNGTDFYFVTEGQFTAMRARDEFAEWAEVHGHLYGTPAKALEGALGRGLDVLLDIDTHGARQLRQRYPEAVSVFIMAPSIAAATAGVTTGEWGGVLREVFGEYRAPTGIHAKRETDTARLEEVRQLVDQVSGKLGRRLTFVVGKPGLDGHSNGAEQIAVRATDVGMEVVYDGIRLTPAQIVEQAKEAKAHVLGLSILSGSHVALVRDVAQRMREAGMGEVPIVVGGIIPADDVNVLKQCGASAVYTPKDFQLNDIMTGIVKLVDAKAAELAEASIPVPPLRAREKVPL